MQVSPKIIACDEIFSAVMTNVDTNLHIVRIQGILRYKEHCPSTCAINYERKDKTVIMHDCSHLICWCPC